MKARYILYKVVVHTVFIYWCESWVVIDSMMTVMEGFHHRVARRIVVMTLRRSKDVEWEWPPVATALEVTELWPMWEYSRKRHCGTSYI